MPIRTSVLYGNVGSVEPDKAGIFVFTRSPTLPVPLDYGDKAPCNTGYSTRDLNLPGLDFYSKDPQYAKTLDQFIDKTTFKTWFEGAFWGVSMKKWGPRSYTTKLLGVTADRSTKQAAPVVKVTVRNNQGRSRTLLFRTGVAPEDGGHTWVISPSGFQTAHKRILSYCAKKKEFPTWMPFDARLVTNPKYKRPFPTECLFLVVTNSVPLIAGDIERTPDEPHAMLMAFPEQEGSGVDQLVNTSMESYYNNQITPLFKAKGSNMKKSDNDDIWQSGMQMIYNNLKDEGALPSATAPAPSPPEPPALGADFDLFDIDESLL